MGRKAAVQVLECDFCPTEVELEAGHPVLPPGWTELPGNILACPTCEVKVDYKVTPQSVKDEDED